MIPYKRLDLLLLLSSPLCQGLADLLSLLGVLLLLPLPLLLPASIGSSPNSPTSPSPLPAPSVLAKDYALPLFLGKTRWSHASLLHLPGSYELTVRPPPEPHIPYLFKAYYKFLLLIL